MELERAQLEAIRASLAASLAMLNVMLGEAPEAPAAVGEGCQHTSPINVDTFGDSFQICGDCGDRIPAA